VAMKILEPIEIKSMSLKNRIGLPSLVNMPGGDDGYISDLTIRWYEERAKGGAGLIVTGAVVVTPPTPEALERRRQMGMTKWVGVTHDDYITGWAKLAGVIHSYGAKLGVQTVALGPQSGFGPSPFPYPDETHPKLSAQELRGMPVNVHELTHEEIEKAKQDTAAVARRIKEAGVDCIELHLAHGGANLYAAWVSPFYNRRNDEYGGDWKRRLRFPVETIRLMRQTVGDDYPILVRIGSNELMGKWGITLEDTVNIIVPSLEEAGVDCFDVSQGSIMHTPQGITIPLYYPRGCYIEHAAAVKKVTTRPVIGVGNIFDPDMAEKFLQDGKADIIFMGRQLTCDPETPKKYFEGRPEDIRKCIGCLGGCGRPCTINYDIQDEPVPFVPAERSKKVLVIGGGVGGMEAARIAAMRGHKVTLIEKEPQLGGMVATLGINPLTAEFKNIVTYLATQMRKLGVDVRACKEATIDDVMELGPDVAILATGSTAVLPEVTREKPGVMTHEQASREQKAIGERVVVWGLFGVELAITLAEQGKDVTLLGHSGESSLGSDIAGSRKFWLMRKLTDLNFVRETPEAQRLTNPEVIYNIRVGNITTEGITIKDGDGRRRLLPYDTLIISQRFGERKANDSLFEELEGKVPEVYKIGDCLQVRGIKEAIWTANEVARKI
jgi:2,4-dienoyl-CoA reductase-like NADH-dependent reductase (Old Yellow Enzyme family)/thioredoxin reductase